MNIVFHHNDTDGVMSAAVLLDKGLADSAFPIHYGYDRDLIEDKLKEFDEVDTLYFVDFTPVIDDIKWLIDDRGIKVHVVDHHKTAYDNTLYGFNVKSLEELNELYDGLEYVYSPDLSGCELAWAYCHEDLGGAKFIEGGVREEPFAFPVAVHLAGRYDVWDHRDPRVLPFHYGLGMMEDDLSHPDAKQGWMDLLHVDPAKGHEGASRGLNMVEQLIGVGEIVLEALKEEERFQLRKPMVLENWHGMDKVAVYNTKWKNFTFARDILPSRVKEGEEPFTHCIWYYYDGKGYKYSVRRMLDDAKAVNEVAQIFGGGGHAGAAGFYSEDLVFDLSSM